MTNSTRKNTDVLQERFALRTVSHLASATADLPHDISERLRAARFQAIAARKIARTQSVVQTSIQGQSAALTWGSEDSSRRWSRIAALIPLAFLVAGLLLINIIQSDNRAQELADVDVALLTDALPPAAFSDPGFIQFLKGMH
ncbi:MAG: DUF3619 family protein [Polaromonas sp.]